MSDESDLIFLTDPKRFLEVAANDDAEQRLAALANFDDVVLCEIVRYGWYGRADMIAPLAAFYRNYVMRLPEERRFRTSRHIMHLVDVSCVSVNALLPFIAEDDGRAVVSTCVIDYVSLGALTDDDPMSRVKDIIGLIEGGALKNEGAAFGALLHMADERVCRLLLPLRDRLDPDAKNEAVKCSTGFIHAAVADFYLDWLEGLNGDGQDAEFGIVASGLALLRKTSRVDAVFTGRRPFPLRRDTPEHLKKDMAASIPIAEYLKRVAPRIYALERSEPPPRIMPHVLAEWGLQPLTDRAEAAALDHGSNRR